MKTKLITTVIVLIISFIGCNAQNEKKKVDFPELKGPYLGQKTPGLEAELFAPDILVHGKGTHSNIVFSFEGTEAYWCYNGIWFSKFNNNSWTTPIMLPFSKKGDDAPFLSPDGKHLFFTSKRPITNSDKSQKEKIWVVDLLENGWTDARPLPPIVNNMFQHWQISVDINGNLYFGHRVDVSSDKDIYSSKYINGEFQKPEKLSGMINSELNDNNPYISPNGDYLIFSRSKDGRLFDGGLFISFRLNSDNWSMAKPLKQYLNFKHAGNCAIITQNEKYLFFLDAFEGEWQRYWVSTKIIEELKPKDLK